MNDVEIHLNPDDVLLHLEQLGYVNVTPLQLKEFIRDLKKLIKYDLKKQKENKIYSVQDSTQSYTDSTPDISHSDMDEGDKTTPSANKRRNLSSTSNTMTSSSCSESSCSDCSYIMEKRIQSKPPLKKPGQSFIRPRELGPQTGPPRHDPVALYHYYQKFWKTFKQPGEDDHRDLRWRIREKMLGPPQPTVRSTKATPRSSCCSLNRI